MISLRPLAPDALSDDVHPKFLYGYKGWLVFLTGVCFLSGFSGIYYTFSGFSEYAYSIPGRSPGVLLLVSFLHAMIPLLIALSLYFKRDGSLFRAKIGVLLFPLADYVAGRVFNNLSDDMVAAATPLVLFITSLMALPPFLYLSLSRRVKNTYLFWNRLLPKTFECPFCLEDIQPREQERNKKEAVCPHCSRLVSRLTVLKE